MRKKSAAEQRQEAEVRGERRRTLFHPSTWSRSSTPTNGATPLERMSYSDYLLTPSDQDESPRLSLISNDSESEQWSPSSAGIPEEGEVELEFRVVVRSYGFYDVCERQSTRELARALELHLGSGGYELYDEEGRRIVFDPWAADGHHEGHDPTKAVIRLEKL